MTSQVEKITVYSGHGKNPIVILKGKHHVMETDLSSNNDNRWPEGLPSEKALRKLIVRSEVRHERKPEPSHRYHKWSKVDRETRMVEPKNSTSSSDQTGHKRNMDIVEALKQQVFELKRRLKKKDSKRSEHSSRQKTRSKPAQAISSDSSSTSVEVTEEEESSDGRKKGGRRLGRGSRGNWSESPSMTR
jgi:hypothetical protein